MLKVGKLNFTDWYHLTKFDVWRRQEISSKDVYILIRYNDRLNVCEIQLGFGFNLISNILDENLLQDGSIPGTIDEVKKKIDALLLKIGGLASFI